MLRLILTEVRPLLMRQSIGKVVMLQGTVEDIDGLFAARRGDGKRFPSLASVPWFNRNNGNDSLHL